uniref:Uncharacterized protein n=1 Tax=Arundo donax TaxID=35708 RepID=A0A0A9AHJ3_ARUDO
MFSFGDSMVEYLEARGQQPGQSSTLKDPKNDDENCCWVSSPPSPYP